MRKKGNNLEGKVALVTGAGRGIGRAIVLRLAQDGADVAVNDIDLATASETARQVRALGRKSLAVVADVANREQVAEMVQQVMAELGPIDILVNNAGIVQAKPLLDITDEDWDTILRINTKGVLICTQEVARHMLAQRRGKIINMASVAGKVGAPYLAGYCASKFAVVALTQVAARELAHYGITVNAIAPGIVGTAMWEVLEKQLSEALTKTTGRPWEPSQARKRWTSSIALGREAVPEDIAKVASFLASSDSDYITGQTLIVDGGTFFQ